MKQVNRSALLPYTAEQMFDVVNDVASYPEFLPWCDGSRIISSDADNMTAELTVAKSGIRQNFTTRNTLDRPRSIDLLLVSGPFRNLSGTWRFHALGDDGCRVEMQLGFEIDSKIAGAVLARVFEQATDTMVDAFCDRAEKVYGSS